eukprot:scaffold848_cov247-Pinguiococcus_pyrenoidosus.AAC.15
MKFLLFGHTHGDTHLGRRGCNSTGRMEDVHYQQSDAGSVRATTREHLGLGVAKAPLQSSTAASSASSASSASFASFASYLRIFSKVPPTTGKTATGTRRCGASRQREGSVGRAGRFWVQAKFSL